MDSAIKLISQERREQLKKHSFSTDYDLKRNNKGQLKTAAVEILSMPAMKGKLRATDDMINAQAPKGWAGSLWCKMVRKPYKDRLIMAGALIAAEISRIEAAEQRR